jgi:hypothetical protein
MTGELKTKIETLIPKMEGWATVPKALAMAELILEVKPAIIVELGVFGGRSMLPQALALREVGATNKFMDGRIYGVDPMQVAPAIEGEIGEANAQWWLKDCPLHTIHELCMKALWNEGLEPWFIYIRATAEHAAHLFKDIDILHFDQNHSELASMRDIQIYYPLVKHGGYIWFDDTNWTTTNKAQQWLAEQGAETIKEVSTEDGTQFCRLYRKPTPVTSVVTPPLAKFDKRTKEYKKHVEKTQEPVLQA